MPKMVLFFFDRAETWEMEKMPVIGISSFYNNVCKGFFFQGH